MKDVCRVDYSHPNFATALNVMRVLKVRRCFWWGDSCWNLYWKTDTPIEN